MICSWCCWYLAVITLSVDTCEISSSQGHLLLIGVSGAGKTTLSRFVAWMNGLSVFQVKVCLVYTNVTYLLIYLFFYLFIYLPFYFLRIFDGNI